MIVSWNGRLVKNGVVSLPVTDAVFLRGEGVFETIRAEDGEPCLWGAHYDRLKRSAATLGWDVPESGALRQDVVSVLEANGLREARVRVTLGNEVLVTAEKLPVEKNRVEAVVSEYPVNERSPLAGVKGTSYAENMWVLRQSGVDEAIRANTRGELCEGCISNVFFVREGRVFTPSVESGCLPGVLRAEVMKCVEVEEGLWPIEILDEAEEVWLSNAIRRLRFVGVLGGKKMGEPSALFLKVSEALRENGKRE